MITDKVLKRELMSSAFKPKIDITLSDEIDYLNIYFHDKRFDFIENFENQYCAFMKHIWCSEPFWDLQKYYENYCKLIFDKLGYTTPDGIDVTIGNKTKKYQLKYQEAYNEDIGSFSINLGVFSDIDISGFIMSFTDINELEKLYLQHTDSLLNDVTIFMQTMIDKFNEDVCWKYEHSHSNMNNFEEIQSELIKIYNDAIDDLNELKSSLDLPIEKFHLEKHDASDYAEML